MNQVPPGLSEARRWLYVQEAQEAQDEERKRLGPRAKLVEFNDSETQDSLPLEKLNTAVMAKLQSLPTCATWDACWQKWQAGSGRRVQLKYERFACRCS